jgi:excisionase family DNA binding protein
MSRHAESPYKADTRWRLLRARDVAAELAISEPTVWRLARSGELARVRVGGSVRFLRDDVETLIARGRTAERPVQEESPAGGPGSDHPIPGEGGRASP